MSLANPLPGGPAVVQTHGHTPPFWKDRSVMFIANLMAMFFGNQEQTDLLVKEISCPESYGGRLIPLLSLLYQGGNNLLVLEREPDAALCAYFERDLQLKLPELRILRHEDYERIGEALREGREFPFPERLRDWRDHKFDVVDGFVTDRTIAGIARAIGKRTVASVEGSERGNNKLLLHQHLESVELPVFDTLLIESAADLAGALATLKALGYEHAVAKSQVGASGVGLLKIPILKEGAVELPPLFFHEGPCMVQGWIQVGLHEVTTVRSPSVQMFLDEKSVHLYDLTEQLLSDASVHEGNESPPPYLGVIPGLADEIYRQAGEAGRWLHAQGYRGTASADFLVAERAARSDPRVWVCEVNARVTGATYPSVLARHFLPEGAWLMRNLKFARLEAGAHILQLLEKRGDLFHEGRTSGILPINFNTTLDGRVEKGQFLCLGPTTAECHDQLLRATKDLPLDWSYVRD
jgi:hypothetical protein